LGARAGEEVIVHFSALGAEGIDVMLFHTKVERRVVGVVEEEAVSPPLAKADEKRDGLVKRVCGSIKPIRVGIPHDVGAATFVEKVTLLTQAIIVFVLRH
jgi:hypothetical protein